MIDDYPLFTHWLQSTDRIFDYVEKIPKKARFSLASRISDVCLNVMEHIVEAIYTKKREPILVEINLDLEKLRVFFRICHRRRYISTKNYETVSGNINEAGRMVGGWLKKRDEKSG